jgi:hypothetical protein
MATLDGRARHVLFQTREENLLAWPATGETPLPASKNRDVPKKADCRAVQRNGSAGLGLASGFQTQAQRPVSNSSKD